MPIGEKVGNVYWEVRVIVEKKRRMKLRKFYPCGERVCVYIYIYMCIHVHMYMYMYMYVYVYVYVYVYIYIYICAFQGAW